MLVLSMPVSNFIFIMLELVRKSKLSGSAFVVLFDQDFKMRISVHPV